MTLYATRTYDFANAVTGDQHSATEYLCCTDAGWLVAQTSDEPGEEHWESWLSRDEVIEYLRNCLHQMKFVDMVH
jgi:hypothetical protein